MGVGARWRGVFFASVSLDGLFVLASCFLACYRARVKVYLLRHGVGILALHVLEELVDSVLESEWLSSNGPVVGRELLSLHAAVILLPPYAVSIPVPTTRPLVQSRMITANVMHPRLTD